MKNKTTEELQALLTELQHDKKYLFELDKKNKTQRYNGKINTVENKIAKVKEELKRREGL